MRCVLLLALLCRAAGAQEFRGTLTGRVVDPGEAYIGGASVVVTNTGANTFTATKTDSQGNYTVPFLTPGTYSVSVEATGFKKALRMR